MKNKLFLTAIVMGCVLSISYLYNFNFTGIDDANIYFVYMKHLANRNGLVYNIGGEKVEGFTSILWTLIGASIFKFTNNIEIGLLILNLFILAFSLFISIKIIQTFNVGKFEIKKYIFFFIGLLYIFPGFYDWTVFSLLETGLWTFELILMSFLLILPYINPTIYFNKSSKWMLFLLPLLLITRPESLLLCLIFIFIRFVQLLIEKEKFSVAFIHVLPMIICYFLTLIILTTWRIYYFGYPLPNTYYVKISNDVFSNINEGFIYFFKFIIRYNPFIFLFFISIVACFRYFLNNKKVNNRLKAIFVLAIISIVGLGIPFYTGGDHFRMARFYQPYVPIIYVCFILIIEEISEKYNFLQKIFSSYFRICFCLIFLSLLPTKNIYSLFFNKKHTIAIEFEIAKAGRKIENELNYFFNNTTKPSIAIITAGGIAYTYNGYVNDVLGLNNVEVAHSTSNRPKNILNGHRAFNKNVFLKQKPDLFLFEFTKDTSNYIPITKRENFDSSFGGKVIKHIYKDSTFLNEYSNVYIKNKESNKILIAFASNTFLNNLDKNKYEITLVN